MAPYFTKAKGIDIWDADNRKFKDLSLMGVGTNILGYSNKYIDNAVIKSLKSGNISSLNCKEEIELAEKLVSLHHGQIKLLLQGQEVKQMLSQ